MDTNYGSPFRTDSDPILSCLVLGWQIVSASKKSSYLSQATWLAAVAADSEWGVATARKSVAARAQRASRAS